MSKQKFVWKSTAAVILACTIILSGCGNQDQNKGNNHSTGTPSPTPPVTDQQSVDPGDDDQKEEESTTESSSISDLVKEIEEKVEFPMMGDASGDMIKDLYHLDADQYIEEGQFRMAMMNVKATDLVIVKLKDEADFDSVKEALTKRAEDVINQFSTYLPDQYEDAKNYQIVQDGKYVLYSISHDQEKVLSQFKNYTMQQQ